MATVKYKVPSQAASGADTFSDALVGLQITNGTNQLTNANFELDRIIPEKDSKNFTSDPFSDFITLDDVKEETYTGITTSVYSKEKDNTIKFKPSKDNGNVSLFGSLKQRLNVTVTNIIKKFPAGVYVDATTPSRVSDYSAESIIYDPSTDTTDFMVQYSMFYNPLDIVFISPESSVLPDTYNDMRNFFSSYTKYVIDINSSKFNIVYYEEPDVNNMVKLSIQGNCFNGYSAFTANYLIKPNDGYVEEFYSSLDDLESTLLNRETLPKFTAIFNVIDDENQPAIEVATWPLSFDNWNVKISGLEFDNYVNLLSKVGDDVDTFKSNLINRFLVSPQLLEFDTEDKKIESIFQIYGQSFDKTKKYIDNIANMRNITYDGVDNVPDVLLKSLSETLGFSTTNLFNSVAFDESVYDRSESTYDGISIGYNLVDAEYETYRRLLNNLVYLYKSKGTRKSVEFLLKFIGAPDPMIVFNEYVYLVNGSLPTNTLEQDILEATTGTKYTNIAVYNTGTSSYTISKITGVTQLYRDEYPVDESTGLPRKITSSDGSIYFEMGAGWYQKTLEHRSVDVLDSVHSDLTSRIKTIKTMSKPFTYGEDYFDYYRTLPGLSYGYDLVSGVDNIKTKIADNEEDDRRILNRKNIDVFLSASNTIDYDIYRKLLTFDDYIMSTDSILVTGDNYDLQTLNNEDLFFNNGLSGLYEGLSNGLTFEQFLNSLLNVYVTNSNVTKYDKSYGVLNNIFGLYYSIELFKSYDYTLLNEYINKLSPNWINIVEQFIPATTLWLGGNLIQNSSFTRPKHQHLVNRPSNLTYENVVMGLVNVVLLVCHNDHYDITATTNEIIPPSMFGSILTVNVYDFNQVYQTSINGQFTSVGNTIFINTDSGTYQGQDRLFFEIVLESNGQLYKSNMYGFEGDC